MDSKYKFLVAGATNTAITFTLYALMVAKGVNYNVSLAVTYTLGIMLGFLINRLWTFAGIDPASSTQSSSSHSKPAANQFFQYVLVYALMFIVNFIALNLLVRIVQLDPIVSQAIAVGVSTVCSYLLQKSWVFK